MLIAKIFNQIKADLIKHWLLMKWKNRNTRRKVSRSREENQRFPNKYGVQSRNLGLVGERQCCHQRANPPHSSTLHLGKFFIASCEASILLKLSEKCNVDLFLLQDPKCELIQQYDMSQ